MNKNKTICLPDRLYIRKFDSQVSLVRWILKNLT